MLEHIIRGFATSFIFVAALVIIIVTLFGGVYLVDTVCINLHANDTVIILSILLYLIVYFGVIFTIASIN